MFVQVVQGQVADAQQVREAGERWLRELQPGSIGWLGTTSGVTADGTAVIVARFESAEAARRNSDRPEQTQWWMETSKLFAGDVAFHDCPEVYEVGAGGSDRAGFVQVIQGRTSDPDRARSLLTRSDETLREFRPDVIGGLICVHGDNSGDFTQVFYFTSEQEARAGERKEPTPQVQALMADMQDLFTDMKYYDLTRPYLDSPSK
jgi:hypothetical protein